MKYAFFPGCVSRGGCPELYQAAHLICQRLGIELEEMPGASCTGAGVLQEKNEFLGDTLNARTFAMAEGLGLPIMTICSTCQGVMSQAIFRMRANPEYLARVNAQLAEENLEYKGTANPKHLLWILIEDVGLDTLTEAITRPLAGVRIAPFYGCYLVRPTDALDMEEHPERQSALETLIETLGATLVDFSGKTRCCGFPMRSELRRSTSSSSMDGRGTNPAISGPMRRSITKRIAATRSGGSGTTPPRRDTSPTSKTRTARPRRTCGWVCGAPTPCSAAAGASQPWFSPPVVRPTSPPAPAARRCSSSTWPRTCASMARSVRRTRRTTSETGTTAPPRPCTPATAPNSTMVSGRCSSSSRRSCATITAGPNGTTSGISITRAGRSIRASNKARRTRSG
ncbi:MAG: hypothetical protein IIA44_04235 [Acidobacteria bacterium]|nr:hypothetical protein [Acidobacteriota bacterium]